MVKTLVFVSLMFVLGGCSKPQSIEAAPALNHLKKGQQFLVILPEIHTDGATWRLSEDYNKTMIGRIKEVWHGPDKGIYYYLESLEQGQTELHFVKRKYSDTIDYKTFRIEVAN